MKRKDGRGILRMQCYYTVINMTIICTLTFMYGYCNHKYLFIVDTENSSGINNVTYTQPITFSTGI